MFSKMLIDDKTIKSVLARLDKLEKAVFGSGKKKVVVKKQEDFSGPKGGVLFLLTKGFLNKRKTASEVHAELQKNDYHYQLKVVRTALDRMSKGRNGLLTSLLHSGKKVYAKRK